MCQSIVWFIVWVCFPGPRANKNGAGPRPGSGPCANFGARGMHPGISPTQETNQFIGTFIGLTSIYQQLDVLVSRMSRFSYSLRYSCKCPDNAPWSRPSHPSHIDGTVQHDMIVTVFHQSSWSSWCLLCETMQETTRGAWALDLLRTRVHSKLLNQTQI